MILLRLLSWPYLRKHVLRWTFTIAGIVLGVAVLVATRSANQSVLASFNQTVDRIAGKTQLQVWAGDFGFDEDVLERVQAVPEVRVAVPVIQAALDTGLKGEGSLLILGTDMTGDRSLRDYDLESGDEAVIDDPLVFLAQPDSLMVSKEFAARTGLAIGSRLALRTMESPKQFTIRGIMSAGGLAQAFGGNVAVMDIYAAQKMFGRGRKFDRIDLAVNEGVPLAQCQAALRRTLGPGFEIEPPSARGKHFESIMRSYSLTMKISSLFALVIGMFIIYNAFAIAVTQRRGEIGILRALGATRRQVRTLFLAESAAAGLIGSAAGAALGVLLARGISREMGVFMEQVYGVAQNVEDVSVEPWLIAAAVAIGIATSMFAAWIPARNAARVDPVQALQKGRYQVLSEGENRLRVYGAALAAVGAAACLVFGGAGIFFYIGYVLAILTALLLAPALALTLTRMLRPVLAFIRPVEGALAADSLIQAPRRTSATVSALMLSLAMVIGFGGITRSVYASVTEWLDTALNPDFFVSPTGDLANRAFAFPPTLAAEIQKIPGVAQTQMVRSARTLFRGVPVTVVAAEVSKLAQKVHRKPIAGDLREMYRQAAAGKGVMISDSFAGLRGVRLGDTIELPTPGGMLRLPVAGITRDFSDDEGSVLIDRAVFRRWWNDDQVSLIRVYLEPGAGAGAVKRAILDRFASRRLFVLTNADVRKYILRLTDEWFAMTYNQIAVALLVAVLGIVNTLTVSITDRRRELGVLQAVGGLRKQIRHTVWMEALAIGIVGLILGLSLGAVNLYYTLGLTQRDFAGIRLDYIYPAAIAAALLPLILGVAWVAALAPAESAVRGSLLEALEYE
ncbi:MAG: ABC transporter permease [Acidobacteriota bacterium]